MTGAPSHLWVGAARELKKGGTNSDHLFVAFGRNVLFVRIYHNVTVSKKNRTFIAKVDLPSVSIVGTHGLFRPTPIPREVKLRRKKGPALGRSGVSNKPAHVVPLASARQQSPPTHVCGFFKRQTLVHTGARPPRSHSRFLDKSEPDRNDAS